MDNTEKFICKSKKTHGDKYDYSLVDYVNNKTKVKIICPTHGIFEQTPKLHKSGYGCKKCTIDSGVYHTKKKSLNNFIIESKRIHGDKYDYSLVDYVNNKTKVKIICPTHGIFEQTPLQHITLKQNCKLCVIDSYKGDRELFIEKSRKTHGDKYDYSLVEYINNKTKVKIICPTHGIFVQRPDNHISGNCCPVCSLIERRIKMISIINDRLDKGLQVFPNYNKNFCKFLDEISLESNTHIQHAMNGGEYYIKELGYWVDGYDKENNIVYEFDEKYHKYKSGQKEKDKIRQLEIETLLSCEFIRIVEK